MNPIALGIAQIHFYEELKKYKNFDEMNVYSICFNINYLDELLEKYITNKSEREEIRKDIRYIGEQLADMGKYKLMSQVSNFLELKNEVYGNYLNGLWDGIDTWIS